MKGSFAQLRKRLANRECAGGLLLRVGLVAMLFALALAAGVALVITLQPEEATSPTPPEETPAEPEVEALPVAPENWPEPSEEQIEAASAPRYYTPTQDTRLSLTVDKIGIYDAPVINSESREALDRGVIHLPQTSMPWDEAEQKNVYLAGHRLGWPGTGSYMIFFNLDKLETGDTVVLEDGSGNVYEYRVKEIFVATPESTWAMNPVRGRDIVTLQTCTYPDLVNRLIVRADRV